jgi:hypothetical protein
VTLYMPESGADKAFPAGRVWGYRGGWPEGRFACPPIVHNSLCINGFALSAAGAVLTVNGTNGHGWTRSLKGQLSVFICVHPWLENWFNHGWTQINTDKGQLNKALCRFSVHSRLLQESFEAACNCRLNLVSFAVKTDGGALR